MVEQRRVVALDPAAPPIVVTGPTITAGVSSTVAVAAATVTVLADNPARLYACITNLGTQWVYLHLGTPAVLGEGIPLAPNGLGTYEITNESLYTGQIDAISNAIGSTLAVEEGT